MKEFSHIEVRIVRNEKWLKQHHPFYLSETFPIADFELPSKFDGMCENDLEDLRKWLLERLDKILDLREEENHT